MNFSPVGMKCCPALYQFISTFINRQYSISRDLFKREHNHALSMRMQLGIQVCVQLNGSGWAIDRAHMAVLLCFQVWLPCSCNNIPTTTCTVCTQSKKFATKLDARGPYDEDGLISSMDIYGQETYCSHCLSIIFSNF